MNIKAFFIVIGLVAALTACDIDGNPAKVARDNGGSDGGDPSKKPDPIPAKVVEKIQALYLQEPTHVEADFLNVMDLDLTTGDRALFSFSYAPGEDGILYFTFAQARLHLHECTKSPDRSYQLRIFWRQAQGNKYVILKEFSPNIDSFEFKAGGQYRLSYALMDLKEFSDCKSATLKFASFLKNY
jgi:hypothetical protein